MHNQLSHYTLNTGHGRLTDRCEVADDVLDFLRPIVEAGGGDLPMGLRVMLARGDTGSYLFMVFHGEAPLVTCGLAVDDDRAAELWPALLGLADQLHVPRPKRAPPAPWLSIVMLPGLASETVSMLGDLEWCLAWAILDAA
ncbi:MAG: hypothetical protein ABIP48_32925 [Planctomycetota bacterium]